MSKTKAQPLKVPAASQQRLRRILRVVARVKKTSGMISSGYTVMLPFSRRLTRSSKSEFGADNRRELIP
jgi:hypothetical protein